MPTILFGPCTLSSGLRRGPSLRKTPHDAPALDDTSRHRVAFRSWSSPAPWRIDARGDCQWTRTPRTLAPSAPRWLTRWACEPVRCANCSAAHTQDLRCWHTNRQGQADATSSRDARHTQASGRSWPPAAHVTTILHMPLRRGYTYSPFLSCKMPLVALSFQRICTRCFTILLPTKDYRRTAVIVSGC